MPLQRKMASDSHTSIVHGATLSWIYKEPLLISLSLPGSVRADRWAAFIRTVQAADPPVVIGLGLGAVEINTNQRREISSLLRQKRSVVIVDHPIARGITTALSWLGMPLKGFSWKQVYEAAKHLDAKGLETEEVVDMVRRLCQEGIDPSVNGVEIPEF
jgi:hypothetical protein